MASWFDVISFLLTALFFGGVIYGVLYLVRSVTQGIETTKEKLKERGYDVSAGGVKVKTSKRFDRDDYVDATQRGFVKAMEASTFRKGGAQTTPRSQSLGVDSPPLVKRTTSSNSVSSEKSEKKGLFTRKKKE
ncbi:hypothetical protein E1B28_013293 [Marasmius oreades]|uniref:Uncharacterized protein n=1 Tax=Marasmius oreades TaxID=181124 RepID=A0A9P7UNV8_9AGAR|nr:uncharacterized protein E1B28_013293 [Marasmius oreades]KAG7087316.1 hypothetical protein E1B28_013293 [Marasmius oreades]